MAYCRKNGVLGPGAGHFAAPGILLKLKKNESIERSGPKKKSFIRLWAPGNINSKNIIIDAIVENANASHI